MKIIMSKKVFRGPTGTTSLTLRDRLLSYLRFWLNKSGLPPGQASMVTSAFAEELTPLFHGKFEAKDWVPWYVKRKLVLELGMTPSLASQTFSDIRKSIPLDQPLEKIIPSIGKKLSDWNIPRDKIASFMSSLSSDLGSDLRDLTDEERTSVKDRAMGVLYRLPKPLSENVSSGITSFVGIIDDYAKGETQETDPVTKGKRVKPEITLMIFLSDLFDKYKNKGLDDFSVRLNAIEPNRLVETAKGDKPIGPGFYELIATAKAEGLKSEEESVLDVYLGKQDPKDVEKSINQSIRKIMDSKSVGREEGKGEWLRAVREDPIGSFGKGKIAEPKYSSHFSEASDTVKGAIDKITKLRGNIMGMVGRFPSADFSLPNNVLLDVVSELSQSAQALDQALLGKETIDLSQFAQMNLPADARNIYAWLSQAKSVLAELLPMLKRLSGTQGKPAVGPTSLVPEPEGDREKRLLDWEIALVMGVANRGLRAIDEVIGDKTFWHQFSVEQIPAKVAP